MENKMRSLIDAIFRLTENGPLKYLVNWPLRSFFIIKYHIDSHYYELPQEMEKREILVRWGKNFDCKIFVETGTYNGKTTEYASNHFDKCVTIELDETLYKRAVEKFKNKNNVQVRHGDSGTILPEFLRSINERTLFWLDAHYCGRNTAKGKSNTPIMEEILAIMNHPVSHVILIDDARMYLGFDGYPSIRELRKLVNKVGKGYEMTILNDIIRIYASGE